MKYLLLPIFLLLSFPFFAQTPLCPNGISPEDAAQLKSIYLSTNGTKWSNQENWNDITTTAWHGVRWKNIGGECRVDSLVLTHNKMEGNLPSDLQLPYLRCIWLTGNELNGNIPDFDLPALETLRLAANKFTGAIPTFSKLKMLTFLDLSYNQFNTKLPLFDLPKLKVLKLYACGLHGTIPKWNLPSLEILDLNCNNLDSFPENGLLLPKITFINVSHNEGFKGSMDFFSQFPTLTKINISFDNNFSFLQQNKIQDNIRSISVEGIIKKANFPTTTFPNLTSLVLSRSNINFDENAAPLKDLKSLTAKEINQKSFYPGAVFPNLSSLDIENSNFGTSLHFVEQLPFLEKLNAYNCNFEQFDFGKNKTSYALKELNLKSNHLQGDLAVLQNFEKLETVDLSNNNFAKTSKKVNLPFVKNIDVSNNQLVFSDLDSLIIPTSAAFVYSPQAKIDILSIKKFDGVEYLHTQTGNPNGKNTYKWFMKYGNSSVFDFSIERFRKDSMLTPSLSSNYSCEIRNPKYPSLLLFSNDYEYKSDEKTEQAYDFLFYPNPCRDVINIHFFNPVPSKATLSFYDSRGQFIFKKIISLPLLEEKVNISELAKGVYVVKIETSKVVKTKKIVVE